MARLAANERMRERPASREQIVALLAEFKRAAEADDPRTCDLMRGQPFGADRDGRIEWAKHYLGVTKLDSFSDLTARQAAYLLDTLLGQPTKLDGELARQWERLGVRQPEHYFDAMKSGSGYFKFHNRGLGQLNRYQKWKLVSELKTRRPGGMHA